MDIVLVTDDWRRLPALIGRSGRIEKYGLLHPGTDSEVHVRVRNILELHSANAKHALRVRIQVILLGFNSRRN